MGIEHDVLIVADEAILMAPFMSNHGSLTGGVIKVLESILKTNFFSLRLIISGLEYLTAMDPVYYQSKQRSNKPLFVSVLIFLAGSAILYGATLKGASMAPISKVS